MKCLTITVDDREFFSGEVAEFQWTENGESVSMTGRFKPAASLMEKLAEAAQTASKQKTEKTRESLLSQNDSVVAQPAAPKDNPDLYVVARTPEDDE